jgi:hypothetical protein
MRTAGALVVVRQEPRMPVLQSVALRLTMQARQRLALSNAHPEHNPPVIELGQLGLGVHAVPLTIKPDRRLTLEQLRQLGVTAGKLERQSKRSERERLQHAVHAVIAEHGVNQVSERRQVANVRRCASESN